ncbi:MAG: lipoprotein LpqV [Actinomycetota bacterium]|nr:lipoprotein LpqV [Actinomycetota bacterium]
MRRYLFCTATAAALAVMLLTSCSSDTGQAPAPSEPVSAPATVEAAPEPQAPPAPGEVAVSPAGVTTAVGAPAESTEDDYFQACMAARSWMEQQGGDPRAQIEPFLATLQDGQHTGPATFGRPWAELSAGQQSAVIVAVEAAADQLCG